MIPHISSLVVISTIVAFSGCSQPSDHDAIILEALQIKKLPSNTAIIDGNFSSGSYFGFYEFYLETQPEQFDALLAGRDYEPCAIQNIHSHEAFSSFNAYPNILLVHCIKSVAQEGSVSIYRDKSSRHVFITYDH